MLHLFAAVAARARAPNIWRVRSQVNTLLKNADAVIRGWCRPGGSLVYSTCSFSTQQNEDVVQVSVPSLPLCPWPSLPLCLFASAPLLPLAHFASVPPYLSSPLLSPSLPLLVLSLLSSAPDIPSLTPNSQTLNPLIPNLQAFFPCRSSGPPCFSCVLFLAPSPALSCSSTLPLPLCPTTLPFWFCPLPSHSLTTGCRMQWLLETEPNASLAPIPASLSLPCR